MMYQIQERDAELRGEKRGEQNASLRIARQMLSNNLAVEMVAKMCGLPVEQVLAVKAQLASN